MSIKGELSDINWTLERINERLGDLIPEKPVKKTDIPTTEVSILWVDKAKGLIACNKCGGTGRESSSYGEWSDCRFCEGQKVIKLVDRSKVK